jgi:uncharacterized protein HemX
MKIGDLLLLKGYINKKQLKQALHKQAEQAINYDRPVHLGKILIEEGHITVEEVAEALNDQQIHKPLEKKEEKMAHKIGEDTSFQMDLKFLFGIMFALISAVGVYFTLTGAVEDNTKEIDNIKSMGDLKIISYKLEEYDETFKELKSLATKLSPMAIKLDEIETKMNTIQTKISLIQNKSIDLSGIDECKTMLQEVIDTIDKFEKRLTKVEKSSKGRF